MKIKLMRKNAKLPIRATEGAGGYDVFMPANGIHDEETSIIYLGFSAEVPAGHVALILPRSSIGGKHGVELNNTVGVIDSDFRGEWCVILRTKSKRVFSWLAGDRLFQFIVVPVATPDLELVEELSPTHRGPKGFGSTGK